MGVRGQRGADREVQGGQEAFYGGAQFGPPLVRVTVLPHTCYDDEIVIHSKAPPVALLCAGDRV